MNPYECESPGLLDSTDRVVYPWFGFSITLMSETNFCSVWQFVGNTGLQALPNNCFKGAMTDVLNLLMLHAENRALDKHIYIYIYMYIYTLCTCQLSMFLLDSRLPDRYPKASSLIVS